MARRDTPEERKVRRKEVARLVSEEFTTPEIAALLGKSNKTINTDRHALGIAQTPAEAWQRIQDSREERRRRRTRLVAELAVEHRPEWIARHLNEPLGTVKHDISMLKKQERSL